MNGDKEWQRLCDVYAEQADGQLLALYDQRDGLTDLAQQALADAMKQRGLKAESTVTAAKTDLSRGQSPEEGTISDEELQDGEAAVWSFVNGSEAADAVAVLKAGGVPYRIAPDRESRILHLVVKADDVARCKEMLRDGIGLFPLGAEEDLPDEALGVLLDDMALLVMFDREDGFDEALAIAAELGKNGISFLWRDGHDAPAGLPDEESISIEVRRKSLRQAEALVQGIAAHLNE